MDTTDGAAQVALLQSMDTLTGYSSESDLQAGCRRQDIGAFEALYKQHGSRLKSIAYRRWQYGNKGTVPEFAVELS